MQCQAKAKSTGKQCNRSAVNGKRVCVVHGGKTPSGLASPHFKTGRYSKYIPDRLAARYEEAQADSKLLELREEVALVDSRIGDLLSRVDTGESGALYKAIQKQFSSMTKTFSEEGDIMSEMTELGRLINQGIQDWETWTEIQTAIEQRRKLVETERKHLRQMEQLVTVNEMMLLASALLSSVKSHVTDRTALGAISADFNRLINVEA